MKCYYETLEIDRDASDGEIKTAYRKLALKWHPDKNIDTVEEAKNQFQLVQQAYEVLSDRQERAWYDNHREQILRGCDSSYEDNSLDVFQYFTTQCFTGFGDDVKGFYAVYRKVFEQIAQEDIKHMDSKSDFEEIPGFGYSSSDYEEVVGPFYAYWMSYSTRKSYVWLDKYNMNECRERRVLKLMEKENKKIRQKAKKERNEEIRNLIGFVRKRDKRVQAYAALLETKNAENRLKQKQHRDQQLLERQQAMTNNVQADWCKFDNVQLELNEIEKKLAEEFGESDSDSDPDLHCPACNKSFKNPKAFANHESSKKHKENVEILKEVMRQEEGEFNEECDLNPSDLDSSDPESIHLSDEYFSDPEFKENKKKKKKNKKVIRIHQKSESSDFDFNTNVDSDNCGFNVSKKQNSNGDFDPNTSKKQTKPEPMQPNSENLEESKSENQPNDVEDSNLISSKKQQKKKSIKTKTTKIKVPANLDEIDTSHCCVTCQSTFKSKNKLFEHLKQTKHSVLLPQKVTKPKKKLKGN